MKSYLDSVVNCRDRFLEQEQVDLSLLQDARLIETNCIIFDLEYYFRQLCGRSLVWSGTTEDCFQLGRAVKSGVPRPRRRRSVLLAVSVMIVVITCITMTVKVGVDGEGSWSTPSSIDVRAMPRLWTSNKFGVNRNSASAGSIASRTRLAKSAVYGVGYVVAFAVSHIVAGRSGLCVRLQSCALRRLRGPEAVSLRRLRGPEAVNCEILVLGFFLSC